MGGEQPQQTSQHIPLTHADVANYLPEYVAEALSGGEPEVRYPQVAAHLVACATCQADFAELLAITKATYDDEDELPAVFPPPLYLWRLRQQGPQPDKQGPETEQRWSLDAAGRWLVELTADLLNLGRPSALVGLARAGDLLYDLRIPAATPEAPELRLEIFDQADGATVLLRASVDTPERDPLEMGGIEVLVTAGGQEWRGLTDDVGTASLSGIPRQALRGAQIAIRAGRSA